MSELYYLHVSPWSEKARWAMDLNHFSYDKVVYTPMVSTLLVRLKTRNLTRKVTVPALLDGTKVLSDSYQIAQYANKAAPKHAINLFPDALNSQIDQWESLSEQILRAGRALVCIRMKNSKGAKLQSLPPIIPNVIRPLMLPVATMGLYYFKAKYQFDWNKSDDYIQSMRNGLKKVRSQLASKGEYLLGEFTYADIAIAVTLQMVEPIDQQYIVLDKDTQNCWRTPTLAEEFADLLEWRDCIYKKHRLF